MKVLKFATILLLGFAITAQAALDLELTKGVDRGLPVAVVPFTDGAAISNVITTDLQNSGYFKVTTTVPAGAAVHDFSAWRQNKVNDVVVGSVTPSGSGYQVSFQLLDVYGQSTLLDKQFTVSQQSFRALAHHISDLVYQQLLGQRGIFSTRIAYILVQRNPGQQPTHKLMVADVDGYNPQVMLTSSEPIMSPAWSPDGKQIAYVSFEGARAAIYAQNVMNGQRQLVSKFPGINGAPAWSPDGKELALVLTKSGYPKIYTLDMASKKFTQITFGSSLDTEPAWSPDGKTIIFTSSRGGGPQIYQVSSSGGKVTRVTYKGSYNARGSFTPDGKSIVMLHGADGEFNIAMQDLASGRVNILTKSNLNESPSVAPNGQMVVYSTNYAGRGVLAEVSVDDRVELRLPAQEGQVQEPAWSPFLN